MPSALLLITFLLRSPPPSSQLPLPLQLPLPYPSLPLPLFSSSKFIFIYSLNNRTFWTTSRASENFLDHLKASDDIRIERDCMYEDHTLCSNIYAITLMRTMFVNLKRKPNSDNPSLFLNEPVV
jgi:hypothetical protein